MNPDPSPAALAVTAFAAAAVVLTALIGVAIVLVLLVQWATGWGTDRTETP